MVCLSCERCAGDTPAVRHYLLGQVAQQRLHQRVACACCWWRTTLPCCGRPPACWSICLRQWSCCVPSTSPPLFLYCDTGQPDLHYTDLHCLLDYRHTGRSCFAQSLPCLRFTRDQPVRSIEALSAVLREPATGLCCNVPGAAQLVHPFLCPLRCLLPLLGMATADMVC